MRCLTSKEVENLFGPTGFGISSEQEWCRKTLFLKQSLVAQQTRIGGRPTPDVDRLSYFAGTLNRWLPTDRHRLLWLDDWNSNYPSIYKVFAAARAGLGETRSFSEAPGHYFDSHPYDQEDQMEISPEQAKQVGIIVGLMSLIMVGGWDAWLVADGNVDRIEFWEGNIFFHSSDPAKVAEAEALFSQFNCPRDLA
jgi:hypothetical protein